MARDGLTQLQIRFVDEYLIDLNATQAAIRAGYKKDYADRMGYQLLENNRVKEQIVKRLKDREKRTEITQDMVLQKWWTIANADPNDIIHLRRVCCRNCFGINHKYQWRDEQEHKYAVESAILAAKEMDKAPVIPSNEGGFGFDKTLRPHPKCPYCHGEGHGEVHVKDTRDLAENTKPLYAGIKQTQAGVEVKFRDQDKALENVARHLGMFTDKIEHSGEIKMPNIIIGK